LEPVEVLRLLELSNQEDEMSEEHALEILYTTRPSRSSREDVLK
jgi:hypothetical protein